MPGDDAWDQPIAQKYRLSYRTVFKFAERDIKLTEERGSRTNFAAEKPSKLQLSQSFPFFFLEGGIGCVVGSGYQE